MSDVQSLGVKLKLTNENLAQMPLLERALAWASQGTPVFFCSEDKRPLTPKMPTGQGGHKLATTDREKIKELYNFAGDAAVYVGGAMGKKANLFVVDVDLYKDPTRLHQWIKESGVDDNPTLTVNTKNGGKHFYFRGGDRRCSVPVEGVEVKAEGGYVILPDGEDYTISLDVPPVSFPYEKLLNLIPTKDLEQFDAPELRVHVKRDVESLSMGEDVHGPFLRLAAHYAALGYPKDAARAVLEAMVDTGIRYQRLAGNEDRALDIQKRKAGGEFERALTGGYLKYHTGEEQELETPLVVVKQDWRERREELREDKPPVWKGYTRRGEVSMFYGADGIGKTGALMTVGARAAAGRDVFFEDDVPNPIRVGAILSEDEDEIISERLVKIGEAHGFMDEDWQRLSENFVVPPGLKLRDVQLFKSRRNKETYEDQLIRSAFFNELDILSEEQRFDLLILDPLSDVYGDNENDRTKVARFMRNAIKLGVRHRMSVAIIGHPAKAEDSEYSGSGAWSSKARVRNLFREDGDLLQLMQRKNSYEKRQPDRASKRLESGIFLPAAEHEIEEITQLGENAIRDSIGDALHVLASNGMCCSNSAKGTYLIREMQRAGLMLRLANDKDGKASYQKAECVLSNMLTDGTLLAEVRMSGEGGIPHLKQGNGKIKAGLWFADFRPLANKK